MKHRLIAGLFILLSFNTYAGVFKMSGAGTTYADFVKDNAPAVEKATGLTLDITKSNTGLGLVDLLSGTVEMSMASEPLDIAVDAAKAAGKTANASELKLHEIKKSELVFVIHKDNPVSKVTKEQIKGIITGKITNWKEVGGADEAITVFSDDPTSGTCALVKKIVNGGADYGPNRKALSAIGKVAQNVADVKSSIGGVAPNFATQPGVKVLDIGMKVPRPLSFITKGEPSLDAAKIIKAFKDLVK